MSDDVFNKIVHQSISSGATQMQATALALALKHACTDPEFAAMYGTFTQEALVNLVNKA